MFNYLIESGSHRGDLARKGRFFLGTLGLYGLLLTGAGIASVRAFDAHLGTHNYEIVFLPPPVVPDAEEPARDAPARPRAAAAAANTPDRIAIRTTAYTDLNTTPRDVPPVSSARVNVPPVPPGARFVIGNENFTPAGPVGPRTTGLTGEPGGVAGGRVRVSVPDTGEAELPPVVKPKPTPEQPKQLRLSSNIISGKVIDKPVPPYPVVAKNAGVSGVVRVEIVIDEQGRVISSRAVDGPLLLRVAAERAGRQARFSPTQLGGQPVKVSGVITYNFVLH